MTKAQGVEWVCMVVGVTLTINSRDEPPPTLEVFVLYLSHYHFGRAGRAVSVRVSG